MIAALVAGLVAGYAIAIPVGAVGVFIVSLTARTSLWVGAAAGLGAATADGFYAMLAVLAGTWVAAHVGPVAGPLRLVSGIALLALAGWGAVTAIHRHRTPIATSAQTSPWTAHRAFLSLLGITVLNPATIVYFTALVVGRGSALAGSGGAAAVFVGGVFVASASWQLLLAGGGAILARRLTDARGRLITGIASSAIIAALAVRVMLG